MVFHLGIVYVKGTDMVPQALDRHKRTCYNNKDKNGKGWMTNEASGNLYRWLL